MLGSAHLRPDVLTSRDDSAGSSSVEQQPKPFFAAGDVAVKMGEYQ